MPEDLPVNPASRPRVRDVLGERGEAILCEQVLAALRAGTYSSGQIFDAAARRHAYRMRELLAARRGHHDDRVAYADGDGNLHVSGLSQYLTRVQRDYADNATRDHARYASRLTLSVFETAEMESLPLLGFCLFRHQVFPSPYPNRAYSTPYYLPRFNDRLEPEEDGEPGMPTYPDLPEETRFLRFAARCVCGAHLNDFTCFLCERLMDPATATGWKCEECENAKFLANKKAPVFTAEYRTKTLAWERGVRAFALALPVDGTAAVAG